MRLTRWWRRGLTRAAARRAGVEWRRRGDVPRWRRCSDHGRRRWRGPAAPEERGEGEAHATCEPRRTEDPTHRGGGRSTPVVVRSLGGEAVR
jgi:hypothetical protein